jgi:hypothetical protein
MPETDASVFMNEVQHVGRALRKVTGVDDASGILMEAILEVSQISRTLVSDLERL